MHNLYELHIKGFKSIRDQKLQFAPLNVFIGGNGVGKSNLVGVFHFLRCIANQQLQTYTGEAGGANTILHFGRRTTESLSIRIEFRSGKNANIYEFTLVPTAVDRFIFRIESESTYYQNVAKYSSPYNADNWTGHEEARITEAKGDVAKHIRDHLDSYRIYHFHDTSPSSPMKQTGNIADNRFLRPDAGNLAAFLHMLQEKQPDHFENIQDVIRQAAPFFRRFRLEPSLLNPEMIRLEWEETGSDAYFGPAALSDGTLRFMCLSTLLLQPTFPSLVLIDEPELGLHPAAIQASQTFCNRPPHGPS